MASGSAIKLYFEDFELDLDRRELRRAGAAIKVDPVVLRLLEVLVQSAGELVTKQTLISQVWDGRSVSENVITVAMVRLRKTLGHKPGVREFVNTVHGRGYSFVCPVTRRAPPPLSLRSLPPTPPFVGRERPLQILRDSFAQASAGHGNACVLSGEPGIGKTRVVEVFERELTDASVFVAWGHCRESGDTPPLWPFAQILRQVLAWLVKRDPSSDAAARAARVPELARLLPELSELTEIETADDPMEPGPSWGPVAKHRVFDAILSILSHASELQPCAIVLDAVHSADSASLELLQSWIDQLPRSRILLVLTLARTDLPQPSPRAHLAYVCGHRNTTRITLQRLSETDVATYVHALIFDPSGELAHDVYAKSEGNAFFMGELARQLQDSDHPSPRDLAMPDAALELVRRRLAILDEAARGALSHAAVLGRRFELTVLQAVSGEDAHTLMSSLDDALAHGVVSRVPDSRTSFTFTHDLLRVALYETLAPSELRRRHLRTAHALEARLNLGASVSVADVAYHYHAALPESDLRKTVEFCGKAAARSGGLFAYAECQRFLRRARQALELMESPSQRLQLTLLMRETLCARVCGDPEFEPLLRELIALARERRSAEHLVRAAYMLDLNTGFPAIAGTREVLQDALEALLPQEQGVRASVYARLATTAPVAYDAKASREQIASAIELATKSKVDLAIYSAHSAELYRWGGELDQTVAENALRVIERLNEQYPITLTVPPALLDLHRAIRALQAGDLATLGMRLERCEAWCRKLGGRELGWQVERAHTVQRLNAGDDPSVVDQLRALHERAAREVLPGSRLLAAYDQCVISADVGSIDRATLRRILARDSSDPPNIWSMKVRALARVGLTEEAVAQLQAVSPDGLRDLPRDRDYLGTLGALVNAVLELGANEYVEPLYELLRVDSDRFAAHVSFLCEGSIAQLRGSLAARLGLNAEARELYARGVELSANAGLARAAATSRALLAGVAEI
ncbi:MAG TPA: AAA family ATPase [Polyangiales bacterium]|nr:AAA family ATPase [Polyangiales bacterium]